MERASKGQAYRRASGEKGVQERSVERRACRREAWQKEGEDRKRRAERRAGWVKRTSKIDEGEIWIVRNHLISGNLIHGRQETKMQHESNTPGSCTDIITTYTSRMLACRPACWLLHTFNMVNSEIPWQSHHQTHFPTYHPS